MAINPTSISDALDVQKRFNVLISPATKEKLTGRADSILPIEINNPSPSTVYAYITGLHGQTQEIFLLQSDGQTLYYPTSPLNSLDSLTEDCSIAITAGSTRTLMVPEVVGGRIWFCVNQTLKFFINPGPALVEPSVTNARDPNYNLSWDFCEFTFDSGVFANISYVDFFALPISLRLMNKSGDVQSVTGIPSSGLSTICANLQAQAAADGAGWDKLIVRDPAGEVLRVLSPNSAISMDPSLFEDYWEPYVNAVMAKYASSELIVDTQSQLGVVTARASGAALNFLGVGVIGQPSSADIFSCNTGAFAPLETSPAEMGNICARVAAAFNRSTLLISDRQPGEVVGYYQDAITNHYARIVHTVNIDGRGYAFPYDDVGPNDGPDQAGAVSDASPHVLSVNVGGGRVSRIKLKDMARRGRQMPGGSKEQWRRGLEWGGISENKLDKAGIVINRVEAATPYAYMVAQTIQKLGLCIDMTMGSHITACLEQAMRNLVLIFQTQRPRALLCLVILLVTLSGLFFCSNPQISVS